MSMDLKIFTNYTSNIIDMSSGFLEKHPGVVNKGNLLLWPILDEAINPGVGLNP